jgi:hypothetical protein
MASEKGVSVIIISGVPSTITPIITPTPSWVLGNGPEYSSDKWYCRFSTPGDKNGYTETTYTVSATGYISQEVVVYGDTTTYITMVEEQKYISNLSNGTDTYIIKDAEARTAIASKQDTLVSGTNIKTINNTSILGSGNINISTGDYDNETITKNGSDELQTVAIVNPNTNSGAISPLKIWQGTEYQWNYGEPTVWNYWRTNITYLWTAGGNLPSNISDNNAENRQSLAYGNGTFIATLGGSSSKKIAYSNDDGESWTEVSVNFSDLESDSYPIGVAYGDGRFVVSFLNSSHVIYSTDNGQTWQLSTLPSYSGSYLNIVYGNGTFIIIGYASNKAAYSTDGGQTWIDVTLPYTDNWRASTYGNGIFVIAGSKNLLYSTDKGQTWQSGTLPSYVYGIAYGSERFVIVGGNGVLYSTDNCQTWKTASGVASYNVTNIAYGDGIFVVTYFVDNNESYYSIDGGSNWTKTILPSSGHRTSIAYGNNKFVVVKRASVYTDIFSLTYDKCYTLDSTPTTSSQVYSAPEITSAKTITSVGSGTITLSDNLVYNSTPAGNQNTYRTLGDAHPNWLCNINNVGVKIGNTIIATAGGTDVEALTDSEIENLWDSNS